MTNATTPGLYAESLFSLRGKSAAATGSGHGPARALMSTRWAPGYMATDMNTALLADPMRLEQLSAPHPGRALGPSAGHRQRRRVPCLTRRLHMHAQTLAVDGG